MTRSLILSVVEFNAAMDKLPATGASFAKKEVGKCEAFCRRAFKKSLMEPEQGRG